MRKIRVVLVGLVVFSLVLVFADTARADHLYGTEKDPPGFPADTPSRINLVAACGKTLKYPANTGFFVGHGWFYFPWDGAPTVDKEAFMSPAMTFELRIDGELQGSAMHAFLVSFPDGQAMFKFFISENHDGLAGKHTFVGTWFESNGFYGGDRLTPVFFAECVVRVNFV